MQTDPTKILNQISRLLSAFPTTASADPDETLRRYFEVLDEFTLWDIETAVDRYLRGKVPGFDGRFAPTPPMLAGQARAARDERLVSESRSRRALPPPEDDEPKDPRISEGLRQLAKELGGDTLAEDAAKRRHNLLARANARFAPDMSPGALMQRLGGLPAGPAFEVGDPEGNADAGEAA